MDFIAIDFETACGELNSACSIGLAFVENLEVVRSEHFLIRPPSLLFSKQNIKIHGILPEQVKDEPIFPEIWEKIKIHFAGEIPIFAHNARFDMSVLMQNLNHYGIEHPDFTYCCSIPFSTPQCGSEVPKNLKSRCEYFGIELNNHHDAKADAIACAQIVIESVKKSRWKSFSTYCGAKHIPYKEFSALNPTQRIGKARYDQIDYSTAAVAVRIPSNTIFSDKHVVITGEFENYSRRELAEILFGMGAIVKSGVTRTTSHLIVGTQDKSIVGEDGMSNKEEKAYSLQEKGFGIKILNEKEIMEIISNKPENSTEGENQDISNEHTCETMLDNSGKEVVILEKIKSALYDKYSKLITIEELHLKGNKKFYNISVKLKPSIFHNNTSSAVLCRVYQDHIEFPSINQTFDKFSNTETFSPIIHVALTKMYNFNSFGCCSKFKECSAAKECLHPDIIYAQACMYRSNLESGKIFY